MNYSMSSRRQRIIAMLDGNDDDDVTFNFIRRFQSTTDIRRQLTTQFGREVIAKMCSGELQDDYVTSSDFRFHPSEMTRLREFRTIKSLPAQDNEISSTKL